MKMQIKNDVNFESKARQQKENEEAIKLLKKQKYMAILSNDKMRDQIILEIIQLASSKDLDKLEEQEMVRYTKVVQ